MKKIINMSLMMALITMVTFSFTSCGNDDDDVLPAKPSITLTEVGHDNGKHAHPGHDLHLEADLLAEGLIQRIDIEIHQEGGANKIVEQSYTTGTYIGVRNAEFHEHIDIPADAPLGEYHLHFTVTDKHGQQTTVEDHIELIEGDEDDHDEED
ncbi:MAG: DUF4625 domain-containing protein [Bacteroidaceae bacterium]|nr:DUF4625 domain-containing protein [Bacteroidaceae bacterium]